MTFVAVGIIRCLKMVCRSSTTLTTVCIAFALYLTTHRLGQDAAKRCSRHTQVEQGHPDQYGHLQG